MKFKKEFLLDELDLPWNDDIIVKNEIYDQRRWVTSYELIFKLEDKLYRTYYDQGSTEQQEEGPWEWEDEVECKEVEPYEETIIAYREVTK